MRPAAPARGAPASADAASQDDGDCPYCGWAALAVQSDQGDVPPARLAHLYQKEGLSTYRIAQLTGLDRQRVTRLLRRAGVLLWAARRGRIPAAGAPPRSAGHGSHPDRAVRHPAAQHTRDRQAARHPRAAGTRPPPPVRYPARTRGGWQREDRRSLPAETVRLLYQVHGLSADNVGRKLDASRKIVLRTAHDLGMPVRASACRGPVRAG